MGLPQGGHSCLMSVCLSEDYVYVMVILKHMIITEGVGLYNSGDAL